MNKIKIKHCSWEQEIILQFSFQKLQWAVEINSPILCLSVSRGAAAQNGFCCILRVPAQPFESWDIHCLPLQPLSPCIKDTFPSMSFLFMVAVLLSWTEEAPFLAFQSYMELGWGRCSHNYSPIIQMFPYFDLASEMATPPQDAAHDTLASALERWIVLGSDCHILTLYLQLLMSLLTILTIFYSCDIVSCQTALKLLQWVHIQAQVLVCTDLIIFGNSFLMRKIVFQFSETALVIASPPPPHCLILQSGLASVSNFRLDGPLQNDL